MQIKVNTTKMNTASADLLSLSRSIRALREEVEGARRRLRRQSQLDECRAELLRQEEALSVLTARLVGLATALSRVSDLYGAAERRNEDSLETDGVARREIGDVALRGVLGQYRDRISQILYK